MDILQNQYFVQGLGFVAFGFGVASFLNREDKKLKLLLTVQCLVLMVHFFLLGKDVAAGVALIGAVRNYLSSKGKNLRPLAFLFIALYVVIAVYRYENVISILPATSSVIATFALFYLQRIRMRLCFVLGNSLWFTHNLVVGSIGPAVMEVMMLCATLRTIYHLYLEDKQKNSIF